MSESTCAMCGARFELVLGHRPSHVCPNTPEAAPFEARGMSVRGPLTNIELGYCNQAGYDMRRTCIALNYSLERALATIDELRAENERLQGDGIHSCSPRCKRTACVLRRRAESAEKRLAEYVAKLEDACDRGFALIDQRDQALLEWEELQTRIADSRDHALKLDESRHSARAWAKRWKAAAKQHWGYYNYSGSRSLARELSTAQAECLGLREALEECRAGIVAEHGQRAWEVNFPKASTAALSTPAHAFKARVRAEAFEEAMSAIFESIQEANGRGDHRAVAPAQWAMDKLRALAGIDAAEGGSILSVDSVSPTSTHERESKEGEE